MSAPGGTITGVSVRDRSNGLARLITLTLLCTVLGMVMLSGLAFLGIDSLRGHVERWSWIDVIGDAQYELARETERLGKTGAAANEVRVIGAFDLLEASINRQGANAELSAALARETKAARTAFLHASRQQDEAERSVERLKAIANDISTILASELGKLRDAEHTSSRRSIKVEALQRSRVTRTTSLVNAMIAAQRILAQVRSIVDFDAVARGGAEPVTIQGLPAVCRGDAQTGVNDICQPSSARLRHAIERLNRTPAGPKRRYAATAAMRSVNAYLRGLRSRFEDESRSLAESVNAVERERLATAEITRLSRGIARYSGALSDVRKAIEALPKTPPQDLDQLDRRAGAYVFQLTNRGRGLFRAEEVGEETSKRLADNSRKLGEAWVRALEATRAMHAGTTEMESALSRMSRAISATAGNVRIEAARWIDTFISAAIGAVLIVGSIVGAGAILAYWRIARPIAHVTNAILQIAAGRVRMPIDPGLGGRTLQQLFQAIETLRRSNLARVEAERRATEATRDLSRAHSRLTRIANNAPAGLFEFRQDTAGKIDFPYRSETFEALFGLAGVSEARVTETIFGRVHSDDLADLMEAIEISGRTLTARRHRFRVCHPVHGLLWFEAAAEPMKETNGDVHWVGTLSDVTRQVQHETEMNAALNKAEAANQAKSTFLANMSHEIRTPMNGIIGMCELLRETELNDEQTLCARTISESASSLLTVINDVLDFSKIEAGKIEITPTEFSLHDLVYDVCRLLYATAQEKGLEICVDFDPALAGPRMGDYGRIRQILLNLIGNAVKFTASGHVLVTATAGEGDLVGISVRDTGIGIAGEDLEAIFQAFEQVDGARTRQHDGTGLGLAITKQLVGLMGGSIDVRSALGSGSEFAVLVPMPSSSSAVRPNGRPDADRLSGRRILVIEELEASREILVRQLRELGAQPVAVGSADEARAMLAAGAPPEGGRLDAAIVSPARGKTTVEMTPTTGGRSDGSLPFPVILHASVDIAIDRDRLDRDGFAACLTRPASHDDICRAFSTVFAASGSARPAGAKQPETCPNPESTAIGPILDIMAADDNRTNRLVLEKMLAQFPVNLRLFANGEEIFEAYTRDRADLLFMDLSMPVMDGLEATRRIRAHEKAAGLDPCPIVALTANALAQHREACIEAGMTGFVTKPLRKSQIAEVLADARVAGGSTFDRTEADAKPAL